uniref:Auxin-responsive protein n=1 Tax=Arundo donax TaxID=35708 RepID=A0A0A9H9F1_ARUDO
MAWSGGIGEAGDSGLELRLGLPAYFSKSSAPGLDAVEGPSDTSAFALQAGKGSNGSTARVRPAVAPVVGWPPVRSFRRNLASSRPPPQSPPAHQDGGAKDGNGKGGLFVKINMDGVPIGRKVDLRAYGGYAELSADVGKLFRCLLAAQRCSEEEVELAMDGGSGEYTLVYEDEDGDRVLVGDVPWEMFVATAKRLRVLKSSDLSASLLRAGGGRKRAATDS